MPFMDLYTQHGSWYVVDGNVGGAVIPADVVGGIGPSEVLQTGDVGFTEYAAMLAPYYEGTALHEVSMVVGWCARYSAAGYMDCTDWCGPYSTEDDALRACREMYGSDEDEDEDDDGSDSSDEELFDGQEDEVQS